MGSRAPVTSRISAIIAAPKEPTLRAAFGIFETIDILAIGSRIASLFIEVAAVDAVAFKPHRSVAVTSQTLGNRAAAH